MATKSKAKSTKAKNSRKPKTAAAGAAKMTAPAVAPVDPDAPARFAILSRGVEIARRDKLSDAKRYAELLGGPARDWLIQDTAPKPDKAGNYVTDYRWQGVPGLWIGTEKTAPKTA